MNIPMIRFVCMFGKMPTASTHIAIVCRLFDVVGKVSVSGETTHYLMQVDGLAYRVEQQVYNKYLTLLAKHGDCTEILI